MTKDEDLDVEIYNDDQKWWVNVKENSQQVISNFEDSIKLQRELLLLAETKIKDLA